MRKLILGTVLLFGALAGLNYSASSQNIEIFDYTLLPAGGNFPADTLDGNAIPGGGIAVDVRFSFVNNTGNTFTPGDSLAFAVRYFNQTDTNILSGSLELADTLSDGDSMNVRFGSFQLFEEGPFTLCLHSLDNASPNDGMHCRNLNILAPDVVEVTAFTFVEAGGTLPDDEIHIDSIPADSTVDVVFEINNNTGGTLSQGDTMLFAFSGIIGNDTVTEINQFALNQDIQVQESGSFRFSGIDIPDALGVFDICVFSLDNATLTLGGFCDPGTVIEVENGGENSVEELLGENMKIYAASNEVVIETGEITGVTNVAVFDLTGKTVYNRKVQLNSNSIERVNTSNLKTGMYIVRLSRNNTVLKTEKVILR